MYIMHSVGLTQLKKDLFLYQKYISKLNAITRRSPGARIQSKFIDAVSDRL